MLGVSLCKVVSWSGYIFVFTAVSHVLYVKVALTVEPRLSGVKPHWSETTDHRSQTRDMKWAEAAYHYLHNLNCEHVTFASHKVCERLVALPKQKITVYLAPISSYGRYVAAVPDEDLSHGDLHDAVLVLDLFPQVSFGHVVLVFLLDMSSSRVNCQQKDGVYLDQEECMFLAVRRRCKNILERRTRRRNFTKRCEVNFLPTVHLDSDRSRSKNHLECRSDLMGFHDCPRLRALNETTQLLCYPSRENVLTCPTIQQTGGTSCRVFEVCDQAVLLSGGWNRLTTDISYKDNLFRMYHLLRINGFKKRNIKIFFANGIDGSEITDEATQSIYPAAMKLAFRYHIQKICSSQHCVDTLVMYLNSPALHDGSSLLWDVNQDGLAEESEKYTVVELLADLADCKAQQVQVIVDQSYSGEVVQAVKSSNHHSNVVVLSSGKVNEYSHQSEFTMLWTGQNDTRACTTDIIKDISSIIKNSTPWIANPGNIRTTLSGAPCNMNPPFSSRELRRDYYGCQNLPTAVWLKDILRESTSETDQSLAG